MKVFPKFTIPMVAATTILIGMNSVASAAEVKETPPVIQNLLNDNVISVIEKFKHEQYTGWLVKHDTEYKLFWSMKDNYVVAGSLLDDNGVNITAKYLEEKKPVPNYDEVFKEFEKEGTYFSTNANGSGEGVMYVFLEPFCGWCTKLHNELQPAIKDGLEVRWIPVSFLSAQSPNVIEYILNSPTPYKALTDHEEIRASKGKLNTMDVTAETRMKLDVNSQFMHRFDIAGTPGIVYQYKGKTLTAGYLPPNEMASLINKIKNQ